MVSIIFHDIGGVAIRRGAEEETEFSKKKLGFVQVKCWVSTWLSTLLVEMRPRKHSFCRDFSWISAQTNLRTLQ